MSYKLVSKCLSYMDKAIMETHPASCSASCVEENENKGSPKATKHRQEADDHSNLKSGRDQVAKSLHSQEVGKRIALHRLEDVVLGNIKNLRVVSAEILDGSRDVLGDGTWQDDLTLGTREEEGVQNLLCGSADVLSGDGVGRRVGVSRHIAWGTEGSASVTALFAGAALGRILMSLLSQIGGHLSVLVLLLLRGVHRWTSGAMAHIPEALQDAGRPLRTRLVQIRRSDENRSSKFAYIMPAERHVLSNIEPITC